MKIANLKICLAILLLGLVGSTTAPAQTQTDQERAAEQALKALRGREIPEATLPCTPDEANWWKELRAAGNAIRRSPNATKQKEFARLVKDGWEKSYQVPTPDLTRLSYGNPRRTIQSKQDGNGLTVQ